MSVTLRSMAAASGAFALVVGSVTLLAHFRGVRLAQASISVPPAPEAVLVRAAMAATAMPPPLAGLDLERMHVAEDGVTAPLPNHRIAHLTLDPKLQKTATALLRQHRFPEAAIVVMDPDTGAVLAYASRTSEGHPRDLVVEASAPSASVFKLATATALVEGGATAQTRECFPRSAEQRVIASDLVTDPLRDRWCMTLATAMGKSENAVFARLAHEKLDKATLEATAHALGWSTPLDFDVPVQPSKLDLPADTDALGFARGAAGFWSATLSPLHGAVLAATVARGGEAVRPTIVLRVTDEAGKVDYEAPEPLMHRAMSEDAARELTTMMEHTVSEGTSFKAFHDAHRTSFVPVTVAGKTGTLADGEHLYTWFVGFAPAHAQPGERRVAISVLVVNRPRWSVKANVIAREMLREVFAQPRAENGRRVSMR